MQRKEGVVEDAGFFVRVCVCVCVSCMIQMVHGLFIMANESHSSNGLSFSLHGWQKAQAREKKRVVVLERRKTTAINTHMIKKDRAIATSIRSFAAFSSFNSL